MDPLEKFRDARNQRINDLESDEPFRELSQEWTVSAFKSQYVYNFEWLGVPVIQFPQDVVAIQEVVWRCRPELIIETGVAHGGSLVLSASLLALLDVAESPYGGGGPRRKVLGVELDHREHNKKVIERHPLSSWIQVIEGSSTALDTFTRVQEVAANYSRVMVILDSNHTCEHVEAELDLYSQLVTEGSYCVVLDTFVEDLPPSLFTDRPWSPGNSPKTAVVKFLRRNQDFFSDKEFDSKLLISSASLGFLRRRDRLEQTC